MNLDEYEREGRALYAAFAATVTAILNAAIGAEEDFRLHQVTQRAKKVDSLRKKLTERGLAATEMIESEIKDLAGCRVVFYTNGDVSRFIRSGIVDENFEILEVKLHQPQRDAEDAAELYISNHYVVRLRPGRLALPEYARFAGMRCEIQIQTILNHAWAEMAHDTIYKAPALGDFGSKAFDAIRSRMRKIARKYLVPAGYEFQKIASDFQRLVEGKAMFDGDALEAIVAADNNNVRADALETFSENVLPFYDDLPAVYPDVVNRLIEAARRARAMPPVPIETPYGTLPPKTFRDILSGICELLTHYRYVDIAATFNALWTLYGLAESDEEQKPLLGLGESLAKHDFHVWRQHGPVVQGLLVDLIEALDDEAKRAKAPLLIAMLTKILETEASGTTNSSNAVTLHGAPVVASKTLRDIRSKAIALLQRQFTVADDDAGRRAAVLALQAATRTPFRGAYNNDLARQVMDDTITVIKFETEIVPALTLELRQEIEDRVHRSFWTYDALPETMREDPELQVRRAQLQAAALAFRDVANADSDFVTYKTLVGFNSVYPPAWEDKDFRYEDASGYRAAQVDALLATVEERDAESWYARLSRYARTDASDAATFPVFGNFLERLAAAKPAIVFGFIDRLKGPLGNFLPGMIAGLMQSDASEQALARIGAWIDAGRHLKDIAWYLRFAEQLYELLLRRTCEAAIRLDDRRAVRNTLLAAEAQYASHPAMLIETVFLPALGHLSAVGDFNWVRSAWHSWLKSPIIRALDEVQARMVLNALVPYPEFDYDTEYIAAAIAEKWPTTVVDFIGDRQDFARSEACPPRYDAVPFEVHELRDPLAAVPDIILRGARTWFDADPTHFPYDGGNLIASVFPELANGLEPALWALVNGGNEQDLAFVLGVLSGFQGRDCIYPMVKSIVARLLPGSSLLAEANSVLCESGVVHGEFGFAELHAKRKALLVPWLDDQSETVRTFAAELISDLQRWIAAENRSAEASIAIRKLDYGEELIEGQAE
ncbi:MAG TPA: RelA/SpoT domain-containing protein [Casimicrobiaceae bacterium]|jgi:ppGpp synthetase/RelA/SpoT-type nucleotidyltranferase|nr:RelA/SpoT domain-containing protein [Casimicrobiaceae bacterium]